MRKAIWITALGLVLSAFCPAQTDIPFAGNWVNSDTNPTGLNMLYITRDLSYPQAQAFLRCGASDCDLGLAPLTLFTSAPDQSATSWGYAEFDTNFGWLVLTLHLEGTYLVADSFKLYTDNSDRVNWRAQSLLRAGPVTPLQISPEDGTTFSNFPRVTVFQWNAAESAATYGIEVDYLADPVNNVWASDSGNSFIQEGLTNITYTMTFVGAQPGRWRVWSIGAKGDKSPRSGWWGFTYTQ